MSLDSGHASEFKRSLAEATSKVESIIDAAETTASQILAEAEAEAVSYRERRQREVDAELGTKSQRFEELTQPLVARVEALRDETRSLTAEIDATLLKLREAPASGSTPTSAAPTPAPPTPAPAPVAPSRAAWPDLSSSTPAATTPGLAATPATEPEPAPPVPEPEPDPVVEPEPAAAELSGPTPVAYPGTGTGAEPTAAEAVVEEAMAEEDSEGALLRATQLAVSGSSRAEIEAALRSEFKLADVDSVLDGILGPEDR